MFEKNVVGPIKYREIYAKYAPLLNGDAARDRDAFLAGGGATLAEFESKMAGYTRLRLEIRAIRNSVLLNLFVLDCGDLNRGMVAHCGDLYDSLIRHQVDTNRSWNRSICNQFDEMATRLIRLL